jgi:hypothetical protein
MPNRCKKTSGLKMKTYQNIETREQRGGVFGKSVLLLAIGIFLIIAPSPDTATLADLTQNFIVSLPW